MYQPESYSIALAFMLCTMFCWGSWANTVKLAPGYRFQLFYWDYVAGVLAGALLWGFTLGSLGASGLPFAADLRHTGHENLLFAIVGGIIFNVANLLLVAAINIAGLAVAFPIGIGLALVVGAISSYLLAPKGNPFILFGGIALIVAAIVCDAVAYRERERNKQAVSRRGIVISLIAGLLMGSFYPFVSRSMNGQNAAGPYAATLFFAIGVAVCSLPMNYLLMRKPLDGGEPVTFAGYSGARLTWHWWGVVGGVIWSTGAVLNFVASRAAVVGPAVSYSIGQGATMISACWGVFIWREFAGAPAKAKHYLAWMFVLFLLGLTSVALAPRF